MSVAAGLIGMEALGTETRGSVNVDLNVVPFIDLMSCLTAFLLVTAVWTNLAQIQVSDRPAPTKAGEEEWVKQSVLVTRTAIHVGLSRVHETTTIPRRADTTPWQALAVTLEANAKSSALSADNPYRGSLEVGAEDDVEYQDMIAAMDAARAAGITDFEVAAPHELSTSFAH